MTKTGRRCLSELGDNTEMKVIVKRKQTRASYYFASLFWLTILLTLDSNEVSGVIDCE